MTEQIFSILGVIGNILLVTAYLPQISKIIKHKHAEDLSLLMWINYLIGDFLLLVYAIHQNDAIVASLFTIMTIGNLAILFLTFKYGRINVKKKTTKEKKEEELVLNEEK
ncbi:PQ-loop repeat-containing protein [Candidatus Peregrinibacteria bacterium]|nr:PQ-loop repeat-containing protein [Candidatus Peregrinibacteria bacterium]